MALAPDSITVTDQASGVEHATKIVSAKHYPVVMLAHSSGNLHDTLPTYYYWRTFTAGAQNQVTIDIFNATGSGVVLKVKKIFLHHNQATVTGVAHVFDVITTTAVGTGGTTITGRPCNSGNAAIPAQVTCRFSATGGATSGHTKFSIGTNPEETLPAASIHPMINWLPEGLAIQEIELLENEGLKIVQVTNSTVGVWGCLLVVTLE